MSNFNINRKIYACLLVLAVCISVSCKKQDSYNFVGDTGNRVFINTGNYTVNSYNSYTFTVTQTPLGSLGSVSAAFPVLSTIAPASDVKVSYIIDTSLVKSFNAAHGTSYAKIPDGLVTLSTGSLTIPQGKTISIDSVKIAIPTAKLPQVTVGAYLVPIKITAVNGDNNTYVSTNQNTAYIIVKSAATNVYNSPLAADMTGAVAASRTGWTATLDAIPTTGGLATNSGSLANMFDASLTSYWYVTPAKACQLVVNMAASKANILGVRIHSYSTSYSLTSANVYTSTDGATWTSQGTATLSTAAVYQYVKFYSPVTAQYVRLDVTGWKSASYVILADFNIYQ